MHLTLAFIQGVILSSIRFALSPYTSVENEVNMNSTDSLRLHCLRMSHYEEERERNNAIGSRKNQTHI